MQHIFVGVAWPYANGPLHLGHIAGAYLPADIFARYHRLKGNQVLMVSGSDQHGTPITLRAEQEGLPPQQVVDKFHAQFLESWRQLGISFDLFTTTGTATHREQVHQIFLALLEQGYIYKNTTSQPYCLTCKRFLPDRYVEGECPHCAFKGARGDQCDNCGRPLNAAELINLQCRISRDRPVFRDTEHFFLKLSAFNERLVAWVKNKAGWRPTVQNFTVRYLEDGLKDRAITRDIEWGVPVPVPGFEHKRIYVWFEAVIGYLSASQQWAQEGKGRRWQDFWGGDVKGYYFIGKDNIPFHTIIWPAMLMGYNEHLRRQGLEELALPHDVPANEFLNLEGMKFSTSRNWAVWVPDFLARFDPDPLRYTIGINLPETSDSNFGWRDFIQRNNNELVATYGNLVHRTISFTYRNFDQRWPQIDGLDVSQGLAAGAQSVLDPASVELVRKAESTLARIGELIEGVHLKDALKEAMLLAREANRYLDLKEPWKTLKTSREETAKSLWATLATIGVLKVALQPFLPFSSAKLHAMLGFPGDASSGGWTAPRPTQGQALQQPAPLFQKLDEAVIEQEMQKTHVSASA